MENALKYVDQDVTVYEKTIVNILQIDVKKEYLTVLAWERLKFVFLER